MTIIFDGTTGITGPNNSDSIINGVTVGKGNGSVSTNTVVGYQAGYSNTTGDRCVYVGTQAGYSGTSAISTAIGYKALYSANTGTENTAVGFQSLMNTTTGNYNTALSDQALYNNTTGSYSTAVGFQAGFTNSTGTYNTFIGTGAGYYSTSGKNTFIGQYAGFSSTGTCNTFVGPRASTNYGAGELMTTGSNNTILGGYSGNQGGLDIRTASNRIVLSDGDGNPRQYFDDSGFMYINQVGQLSGYIERAVITSTSNSNVSLALKAYAENIGLAVTNTNTNTYFAATFCNNGDFSGATKGSISVSNSGTTYSTTSDYRLKENIVPMVNALVKVSLLKPCTYTWKADGSAGQGFIAHELQAVIPDAVTGKKDATETYVDENGIEQTKIKAQAVDTSFIVATLTAAIQELKAEVDSLKAQLGR